MAFTVKYTYKLIDKFVRPIKGISKAVAKNTKKLRENARASMKFSKAYQKSKQSLQDFYSSIGGAALGIAGLGVFLLGAVKSASMFADAMSDVDKVMDLKQKGQFGKFRKDILAMSVPLATMPEDLAKMAYQGGKLGIKAGKGMTGFLEVVSKIKAGFDMSATEAGTLVGDIKAKLGLGVAGIKKLMSQVNYLADNTSADGAKMINVIQRVSSEFSLMKFDTLEVAAFAGAASQIKVSAELAATGLQMAFTKLQQSPIYQQQFQKTPVKTFMTLLKSLRQMDAIARNTKIQKLFGVDAGKFIMGAVDKIGLFEEALTKVKDKKALKSLDKEFANFLKRSSTGFLQLKIKFTKIFIKIGDVFLRFFERNKAVINSAIDGVSEWIEANGNIIPIVLGIIAVVTVLGAAVLAFAAIMAVLNIAMGVFGTIVMIAFSPITLAILTIIGIAYILYKIISGITGKSITGIDKAVASAKRLQESQNNMQNVGFGKGINNSYKTEMMKKSDVNISGEIGVKADKGSQITRNRININQGSNFAVDFGHH